MTRLLKLIALLLALIFVLNSCFAPAPEEETAPPTDNNGSYEPEPLAPYEERNGNIPYFTAGEITTVAYEYYSPLDSLERCGTVHACIGTETMPPQGD
ncbi:MAG: hypothetical protein J6Q69_04250, partial [Clostridia bacterium]|nr:hypothetical protein [Clostridia bacterium]